jgi:hypothetical protein
MGTIDMQQRKGKSLRAREWSTQAALVVWRARVEKMEKWNEDRGDGQRKQI